MIELEKVINHCIKGEHKAQMQLYATFYKRVYNTCFRMLHNRQEAEDAMQESFIKAFSRLNQYETKAPFEAWITRIAIYTSVDKLRENKIVIVDDEKEGLYIPEEENEEKEWEQTIEKVEQVKKAILRLPNSDRLIVSLYLIEGYDHEEIAGILNISPGTSRVQYMRAKQKLIELLKDR